MTEPLVTWSNEHEADYQKRLLAAYRLVYRAYQIAPIPLKTGVLLDVLRAAMSDRTRLLASQWERKQWKKEANNGRH